MSDTELDQKLNLLKVGDDHAREMVIEHSCDQLRKLARKMLGNFPTVRRWSDTDDVLQASLIRLHRSLSTVKPATAREFYALATLQIRRELIDLLKHLTGANGIASNYDSDKGVAVINAEDRRTQPKNLIEWALFHEAVANLPQDQRIVTELLWYQGLSRQQASTVSGISLSTIKRRWVEARITLSKVLQHLDISDDR